ncbi:MAG: hypothetical protein L0241_02780, partial [Planctomycetia bacterium]|nr:hypothetical protein [Planctomycetia bacterium]
MPTEPTPPATSPHTAWVWAVRGVVVLSAIVAVRGAIPFAGGYSDGSRLAAIESLGGRGTFAIDDSVFVGFQQRNDGRPPAYDPSSPYLTWGTSDRMFIGGHFYSHHPPIPIILAAGLYRVWLLAGGANANDRPDLFVLWITITTAGLPYVVAVWGIGRLGRVLGLSGLATFLLTFSFAFATVAAT